MQEILDIYFNASFSIPVILVFEPLEDAWERIYKISSELVQSLPGRIVGLYFMGNATRYTINTPRDFRDQAPKWFQNNKNRVSLINPIFEALERDGFDGAIVMICAGRIIDINDWDDTDILSRTLFARITDEPFQHNADMKTVEIKSSAGSDIIRKELENPVVEVCVKGKGFVPLCCKFKGQAEVICKNGNFKLKFTPEEESLQLHIKAVGMEPPLLYIKRVKGNLKVIEGKKENSRFKPKWQEIPENLKSVVKAGISRGEYTCSQCKKMHKWSDLLCPQGDIVLKGFPLNTCMLFMKESYISLTDYYAYPLKNNRRIITREGNLYEWKDDKWERLDIPILYTEIDDDIWGLYHRI